MRYRVRQGVSILDKSRLYRGGEFIPDGRLTFEQAEEKVRNGFLEIVNDDAPELPNKITDKHPGTENQIPFRVKDSGVIETHERHGSPISVRTQAGTKENVSPPPQQSMARQVVSPWTFNPALLQHKALPELNVMIRDKDGSVAPFETSQEAIAWLSQDYEQAREILGKK